MYINEIGLFFIPAANIFLKEIDNDTLSKEVYSIRESNDGETFSNQGGWHSKYLSDQEILNKEEFKKLSKVIKECVNVLSKKWGIRHNDLSKESFWCNINNYKDFNIPHSHPSSIMSAVYYVKTNKDSGGIVFVRPDNQKFFFVPDQVNEYTEEKSVFLPQDGHLLIFPSYLEHYVLPNMSNEDRISIAYNFLTK